MALRPLLHTMKNLLPILLVAALCGCVSAPTTARKAPPLPMPPLPKGVKLPAFTKSTTVARATFTPAAAPVGYPAVFINGWYVTPPDPPFFPAQTNVFIAADQPSNTVISIRQHHELGGAPVSEWATPVVYGCYPEDWLVGASIAVHGTSFFKSSIIPCPEAMMRGSAETQIPTDKTVTVRGKVYRVINLKRAGENTRLVQRHRLVPK